mmetsp:Transcript_113004/g.269402  ORF Transcript_113004/g.269402 Transcript_113004/m.269402 type:complete len:201 (+) Transcript_113004:1165-1767(+)
MIHVCFGDLPPLAALHQSCQCFFWSAHRPDRGIWAAECQTTSLVLPDLVHIHDCDGTCWSQEVSDLLVVDFQHRDLDPPRSSAEAREDASDGARSNPAALPGLASDHGVSLPCPRLPIGDHCAVVAVGDGIHNGGHGCVVDLLLRCLRPEGMVTHTPVDFRASASSITEVAVKAAPFQWQWLQSHRRALNTRHLLIGSWL